MATLNSPGVSVTVIDESFYTPAASGTAPMIFVVTAQDKVNPSGQTAPGTTKANAGKVWLITSQRDLTDTFGTPLFYTDSSLNPLHGNELNEYGLQAAYSSLAVSSRSYVVRADLDLASLAPKSTAPKGDPVSGTYWVDTANSSYGVKEWNTVTQKFTVKTPIVLNDETSSGDFSGTNPSTSVGQIGDYALVLTKANDSKLFYKTSSNLWTPVVQGFDGGKSLQISQHYNYPIFNASTASGSVWITSTTPSNGANWNIKYYSSVAESWTSVLAPMYKNTQDATYNLDTAGGGKNIAVGSLFIDYNYDDLALETANFKVWRRHNTGVTSVVSEPVSSFATNGLTYTFNIAESRVGQSSYSSNFTVVVTASNATTLLGSLIPTAFSAAGSSLQNVVSSFNTNTGVLSFNHKLGGEIKITGLNTATRVLLGLVPYDMTTLTGTSNFYNRTSTSGDEFIVTNWKPLVFEAKPTAPYTDPADGTLWYSNAVDQVDILVNSGTNWVGYANFYPNADPNGPLVQATEPVTQSDGTPLVTGDIWVDTSDLELYGKNIYVYDSTITSGSKWSLQDTTDNSSPTGWIFADARWATSGNTDIPSSLSTLRSSNYVDPDAPDPLLYPRGLKLWNTRRSGFNVKKYIEGHINILANNGLNLRFQSQSMSNYESNRWVSQYPTNADGSGSFGRKSQRRVVTKSLKSLIDSNVAIRDTDTLNFNIITAPAYPELIPNMVSFNTDRGLTGLVLGDTPFRLTPNATALTAYGLNSKGALEHGEDGATTFDEYTAIYYPSGFTNDNSGNSIVVPSSHMMLRTIINSDAKSYLWFAPAGTRRGTVDNATSVGYLTNEGEFKSTTVPQALRDALDDVSINPISSLTGIGLVAYGQRTRAKNASALDRINVARLVAYLRRQLDILARPFLFEPNDAQTRREIKAAAESLLLELVGQRALYDFIVVCDETNNTPARIDRSELYMDIAVEPVKAVEFIYIPLRIKNKGDIAAGL
jgi:Phage tail sheath C-terminal domain